MKIAVMGASGRTGGRVGAQLLTAGVQVRALGRTAARLAHFDEQWIGDPADSGYLARAFSGVDAAYCLLPYDAGSPGYLEAQARQGAAMASAIRASGLRRVVLLSSLGADLAQDSGMIGSMHDQEERLRAIDGLDAVFLRPGAFFENLDCAREGSYADAVLPDLPLPMVATRDIAAAAAAALLDPAWHGIQIRELLGPRDMSYAEAVAIINGRQPYVCVPYETAQEGLAQAGFAPDVARLTVDIARAINEGRIKPLAGRTAANSTPTRYEDYVKGLS